LASRYSAVTTTVPQISASRTVRRGSFTSPAVKVTEFHASAEKSEPTWATPSATSRPMRPIEAVSSGRKPRPGFSGIGPRGVHRSWKLAATTSALYPMVRPTPMSATSASALADVNVLWIRRPSFRPRELIQVRKTMLAMATNCWAFSVMAYFSPSRMGAIRSLSGLIHGTSTPR
jgi:hypothetical protein